LDVFIGVREVDPPLRGDTAVVAVAHSVNHTWVASGDVDSFEPALRSPAPRRARRYSHLLQLSGTGRD